MLNENFMKTKKKLKRLISLILKYSSFKIFSPFIFNILFKSSLLLTDFTEKKVTFDTKQNLFILRKKSNNQSNTVFQEKRFV